MFEKIALGILVLLAGIILLIVTRKKGSDDSGTKILYEKLQEDYEQLKNENKEKDMKISVFGAEIAVKEQKISDLQNMEERMNTEFENIANKIMKESSRDLSSANEEKIKAILAPLGVKMEEFKKSVDETYVKSSNQTTDLKAIINNLLQKTDKVSEDAENLVKALKNDSKTQGDWGELKLERVLEYAGLEKNKEYYVQKSFTAEDDSRSRPDFIINLPGERNLVVDSKVSLTAYERYFSAENETGKAKAAKENTISIEGHINDLSGKKYEEIHQINSPDYVLMFVPVEGAIALAQNEKPGIIEDALKKGVVVVAASTLLATLKTISFMWKQENQKKNVILIADEAAKLYDKFFGFIKDMNDIGDNLNKASVSHTDAMKKLSLGSGNLVGKVEKIKKLGLKTKNQLPAVIVDAE